MKMSVLIKGLRIPESCAECRFCVNGFTDAAPVYECACESYENVSVLVDDHGNPFNFRPDWCPLISVPTPHGRLGDLDKLKYDIVVGNEKYLGLNKPCLEDVTPIENVDDCIDAITFAPPIIEAEGREE